VSKIGKRHFLKEKETKRLFREFGETVEVDVGELFRTPVRVEFVKTEFAEVFLVSGKPLLARFRGRLIPTLLFEKVFTFLPKVVVDMGAVPHVCNGANVMVPGIVDFQGSFKENDVVLVVDEKHRRPLAVGIALKSRQEIQRLKRGGVVENVHFVGDKLWKLLKRLT